MATSLARARAGAIALAMVVTAAPTASAEDLAEAEFRREGFAIAAAVGPSLYLGAPGIEGTTAAGGTLSLRVGTVATESLSWILQLDTGGYFLSFEDGDEETVRFNAISLLTLGGQYFVREVLWLRAGVGLASFLQREGQGGAETARAGGLGVSVGGGYDLFRRGVFAVDLEVLVGAAVIGGDAVAQGGLLLGLNWY